MHQALESLVLQFINFQAQMPYIVIYKQRQCVKKGDYITNITVPILKSRTLFFAASLNLGQRL